MTDDEGLDALMSTPARPEGDAVAWQWRACISGRWGSWLNVDQPIERFCERNGDHLESGIFELRPLYASPPPASAGVREPALAKLLREVDPGLADVLTDNAAYVRVIRANVIEECAKIAESSAVHYNGVKVGTGIAARIRALAPSGEKK